MYYIDIAGIAQSVEQRTENPCVTSSNLVPGKDKQMGDKALVTTIEPVYNRYERWSPRGAPDSYE